jgi:hypothetical protein
VFTHFQLTIRLADVDGARDGDAVEDDADAEGSEQSQKNVFQGQLEA